MSDFVPWLLGSRTPSIRYLTLRRLLGRPQEDADVQAAAQEMAVAGPIQAILAGQTESGCWAGERGYYKPKYTSTHWSMLLLTELAAHGQDGRLRRGAAYMLSATEEELHRALETGQRGLSCFWGNLLRYAWHSGLADDSRLEAVIEYLVRDGLEGGWCCRYNGELPCAWGTARSLWGLAVLPEAGRSRRVTAFLERSTAFLLQAHHLERADYPTSGFFHPLWFRLNFPLFYQADILFVLRVLAEWGMLDHPGAGPALDWLASRRGEDGRWRGSSPFRRRTWSALSNAEETDRWVSLHGAILLQQAGRGTAAG